MLLFKILHISTLINNSLGLDTTLDQILEHGMEAVSASRGSIMLLDERDNTLRIKIASGLLKETIQKT